ncbi:glyoxalase/bleomycin resistance/extradiol dioxygenase family protein [Catenulispora yoronensis]
MDALHPRLLVDRFPEMFEFYQAVLPELVGAKLVKGTADGYYANWDVDEQAVLVLFARAGIAGFWGTAAERLVKVGRRGTASCSSAGSTTWTPGPSCACGTGRRWSRRPPTGRTGGRRCGPRICGTRRGI